MTPAPNCVFNTLVSFMKRLLLVFLFIASGCSQPAPVPAPPAAEPEALSRTEFTQRVENYFEYEPLHSGKASPFRIHLTDLSDGSPVEQAEVTLTVRPKGSADPVTQTASKVGKVTGIYVAELAIPRSGDYDIEFHIKNDKARRAHAVERFQSGVNRVERHYFVRGAGPGPCAARRDRSAIDARSRGQHVRREQPRTAGGAISPGACEGGSDRRAASAESGSNRCSGESSAVWSDTVRSPERIRCGLLGNDRTRRQKRERESVAEATISVAEAKFADVMRQGIAEVKQLYFDAVLARYNIEIATENRETFQQLVQFNLARFQEGAIPEGDLIKVRLERIKFDAAVKQAELSMRQAVVEVLERLEEPMTSRPAVLGDLEFRQIAPNIETLRQLRSSNVPMCGLHPVKCRQRRRGSHWSRRARSPT